MGLGFRVGIEARNQGSVQVALASGGSSMAGNRTATNQYNIPSSCTPTQQDLAPCCSHCHYQSCLLAVHPSIQPASHPSCQSSILPSLHAYIHSHTHINTYIRMYGPYEAQSQPRSQRGVPPATRRWNFAAFLMALALAATGSSLRNLKVRGCRGLG